MSGALDRYLNEVCWAMGGTFAEQQAVRDELSAHIVAEARELELQGVAPADALARALADLGPAEDVGRSMRASRGTAPLQRPIVQPPGAVVIGRAPMYRWPRAAVMIALTCAVVAAALLPFLYLWPR